MAVMAAERVVGIVPPGTHQWEKLVPPEQLLGILCEGKTFARSKRIVVYPNQIIKWHGMHFCNCFVNAHSLSPQRVLISKIRLALRTTFSARSGVEQRTCL